MVGETEPDLFERQGSSVNPKATESRDLGISQTVLEGKLSTGGRVPQAANGIKFFKQWARDVHRFGFCLCESLRLLPCRGPRWAPDHPSVTVRNSWNPERPPAQGWPAALVGFGHRALVA